MLRENSGCDFGRNSRALRARNSNTPSSKLQRNSKSQSSSSKPRRREFLKIEYSRFWIWCLEFGILRPQCPHGAAKMRLSEFQNPGASTAALPARATNTGNRHATHD